MKREKQKQMWEILDVHKTEKQHVASPTSTLDPCQLCLESMESSSEPHFLKGLCRGL